MIDVIVICNESNCNQCFILCTFQIIIHNVLTDQKVHWTKVQSFHPALNLTFGCDPRPWSLRNIKTLLCLVQFCSKLLDCLSVAKWNAVSLNMKKKIYRNSVCFGKFSLLFKTAMSRTSECKVCTLYFRENASADFSRFVICIICYQKWLIF